MTNKNLNSLGYWLGAGSICFLIACSNSAPDGGETSVATAYEALVAEVANCGQQVGECMRNAQDASARQACRDQRESCREVGTAEVNALGDSARECAANQRSCIESAADAAATGICREELQACIGADAPSMAGTGASRGACVAAMRDCIETGGEPVDCADHVRDCLVDDIVPEAQSEVDDGAMTDGDSEDSAESADFDQDVEDSDESADADEDFDAGMEDTAESTDADEDLDADMEEVEDEADSDEDVDSDSSDAMAAGQGQAVRACVEAFRACIEAGEEREVCRSAQQACRMDAAQP